MESTNVFSQSQLHRYVVIHTVLWSYTLFSGALQPLKTAEENLRVILAYQYSVAIGREEPELCP